MKFSRRDEKRGNGLFDILTEEENGTRLVVSRLGAELVSVARRNEDGNWIGFLYRDNELDAPAEGWANHATVMGYYLHRLKDGHTFYHGHEIKGGNHSFLRTKIWHAIDSPNAGSLRYRITPDDFTSTDYPLQVSVDLTYTIDIDKVTVEFHFTNHEPELTAHVAFGLHPGFAATSFDSFRFEMPAGRYRRYFSPGNFLSGETEEVDFPGGEMPFSKKELPGSFILELVDVPQRKFAFNDPPSGRSLIVDLAAVPYLTLWSDGGAFLCVEPCWGLTDHHEQRAFEDKAGIQTIPAHGELNAGFGFEPRLTAKN
jgi:galactose mutarotase-like enzyme